MFYSKVLALALIASLPLAGWSQVKKTDKKAAATAEKVQANDSATPNPGATDEADQAITNRRLRADAGSLSKWSGSMFFNYQGGSIADPIKPERPNITAGADALTLQNFSGELGVRYRLTALDSLTASTGFFITTPFHGAIDRDEDPALVKSFDKNHQELNVNDPSLKYTHLDKFYGIQSVTNLKPTWITNNQLNKQGYSASYLASQTFMKDVGQTGFSYGIAAQWLYYTFEKPESRSGGLAKHVAGVYPAAEYVINDTFNLRTVFGWQVYQMARADAKDDIWDKRKVYQSVGLGISVTRDIFLYPNIQFIPSDLRSDRTNIAVSANINAF